MYYTPSDPVIFYTGPPLHRWAWRALEQERRAQGSGHVSQAFQAWRYVRPHGRRRHYVLAPGCDQTLVLVNSTTDQTFSPGQRVSMGVTHLGSTIIGQPPAGLLNASRFPAWSSFGSIATPKVERVVGTPIPGEVDQAVTLFGRHFEDGDTVSAQVYSDAESAWTEDPLVTFHDEVRVSATEMTALVDVDLAKPDLSPVTLWVERAA